MPQAQQQRQFHPILPARKPELPGRPHKLTEELQATQLVETMVSKKMEIRRTDTQTITQLPKLEDPSECIEKQGHPTLEASGRNHTEKVWTPG